MLLLSVHIYIRLDIENDYFSICAFPFTPVTKSKMHLTINCPLGSRECSTSNLWPAVVFSLCIQCENGYWTSYTTYLINKIWDLWRLYIITTIVLLEDCLCGSGQSSWLQIQRSGFDSRRYQIFWEVVGLERGPLSLVSTIEELLERESNGSGLEILEYGGRDPSRWPRGTFYPQKLALTSPTNGGRSVLKYWYCWWENMRK
jgi:hypothetical protein